MRRVLTAARALGTPRASTWGPWAPARRALQSTDICISSHATATMNHPSLTLILAHSHSRVESHSRQCTYSRGTGSGSSWHRGTRSCSASGRPRCRGTSHSSTSLDAR